MNFRKIQELENLKGRKVLVRVDYNVPLNSKYEIEDDTRIKESLETIKFLVGQGAKLILVTHLGRPKGKIVEESRVDRIAERLAELTKKKVKKLNEIIGKSVENEINSMEDGEIIMLENIRFRAEEETNDEEFSKKLASYADLYVNDAFGTAHRAHASTAGVANYLESYAGFLMQKEIEALSPLINEEPIHPITLIIGGAKIGTKIGMIKNFIDKTDYVILGGGLANTFLKAAGYNVADSLYEEEKVEVAQEIMLEFEKHHEKLVLPHDVVVASEISEAAETVNVPIEDVIGDMKILDIGKWTVEKYCNLIEESGTVIWNGPMGVYEYEPFKNGTRQIANTVAKHKCNSYLGGGDTSDAIKRLNIPPEAFTHISTGGGAAIEFLEGKVLPGIKPLLKT